MDIHIFIFLSDLGNLKEDVMGLTSVMASATKFSLYTSHYGLHQRQGYFGLDSSSMIYIRNQLRVDPVHRVEKRKERGKKRTK